MFFSFLNRLKTKSTASPEIKKDIEPSLTQQIKQFHTLADNEHAFFREDFSLFYREQHIIIPLFFFFSDRGICFGERLSWDFDTLQEATVQRFSPKSKIPSSTRLESIQSAIHHKLEDILSFDSTACARFIWMDRLKEEEFERLDASFHKLLPKERLIFCDSSQTTIQSKLHALLPLCDEPYSPLKIMGSLQAHTLILPKDKHPYGQFLSDEQQHFLETDFNDTITTLFGEHNSGKSTLILRKALLLLLQNPQNKVLIITPTLLAGEILRNELVSIAEYAALTINYASLGFYAPNEGEKIEENEMFQSASYLLCDDAYLLEQYHIDALIAHRKNRWLLLSMYNDYIPLSNSSYILHNHYQKNIPFQKIPSLHKDALMTLLLELRTRLSSTAADKIMVILSNRSELQRYKAGIDEYFGFNTRLLTKNFSLQYQSLDTLLLTTSELTCGLHYPHIFLVTADETEHYTYALSRASESATIISFSNPLEQDPQSNSLTQES